VPQDDNIAYHDLIGKPILELPADSPGLASAREIVGKHILH